MVDQRDSSPDVVVNSEALDDAIEVEVLPPEREHIATARGRVFDADGHVESGTWWSDFGKRAGRDGDRSKGRGASANVRVEGRAEAGCGPGLLRWFGYALGAALLGSVALSLLAVSGMSGAEAVAWLRQSGLVGRVALVAGVAVLTPLFVPSGLMAVVPGYLWGTFQGTGLILLGAALGGLLNMWLARRVIGGRIDALIDAAPMLGVLRRTIRARGFRIALALRMSPVTPYSMLAYLAGVAGLSYGRFTVASLVGGIPWTSVYAMAGAVLASSSAELSLGQQPDLGPGAVALRWVGLAFTIIIALWIGRAARADLAAVRRETSGLD